MELVSAKIMTHENWLFKVSESHAATMVFAFNPIFQYSVIRFFSSDMEARNWIEFLILSADVAMRGEGKL